MLGRGGICMRLLGRRMLEVGGEKVGMRKERKRYVITILNGNSITRDAHAYDCDRWPFYIPDRTRPTKRRL